jgi:hypothetical protein
MDIEIKMENNQLGIVDKIEIDNITFQKMSFIYNALETGWVIKKRNDSYIFKKNHEGKREIFNDSYLSIFMKDNLNINTVLK